MSFAEGLVALEEELIEGGYDIARQGGQLESAPVALLSYGGAAFDDAGYSRSLLRITYIYAPQSEKSDLINFEEETSSLIKIVEETAAFVLRRVSGPEVGPADNFILTIEAIFCG